MKANKKLDIKDKIINNNINKYPHMLNWNFINNNDIKKFDIKFINQRKKLY